MKAHIKIPKGWSVLRNGEAYTQGDMWINTWCGKWVPIIAGWIGLLHHKNLEPITIRRIKRTYILRDTA